MTYKTRQEVLRAAADWLDVCESAGVKAMCRQSGVERAISDMGFYGALAADYEFPIALLEGKEVWVGSELYNSIGDKFIANEADGRIGLSACSWNPPKPATVMVEMLVEDAAGILEYWSGWQRNEIAKRTSASIKKALESLK